MIKDKLHTISDEDAEITAKLLLKSAQPYNYELTKITRYDYDVRDGVDAEQTVNLFFNGIVTNEHYRTAGWNDKEIWVQLIEFDRYRNYPYFAAFYRPVGETNWKFEFLANQIEAIEFLQDKKLI